MKTHFPSRDYAALIFDCDGTLTNSMPVHFQAWTRTLSGYGIAFPEERFYEMAGIPTRQIIERLSDEQCIAIDAFAAADQKESAFLEMIDSLTAIDGIVEVASHYRGQIPMAVASGGVRDVILRQLERIGCDDWFDAIITAEDTQRHKPYPDVFLEAARQMRVEPTLCLVYEDADLGLEAARAAGMDSIDVRAHFPIKHQA